MRWQCHTCHDWHDGFPGSYSTGAPEVWAQLAKENLETAALGAFNAEFDNRGFVLGNLNLPLTDGEFEFAWGLWVELQWNDYLRILDTWELPGRESRVPTMLGHLQTELRHLGALYPPSLGLEVEVITQPVGVKPLLRVFGSDHPLATEATEGITQARLEEISACCEHFRPK